MISQACLSCCTLIHDIYLLHAQDARQEEVGLLQARLAALHNDLEDRQQTERLRDRAASILKVQQHYRCGFTINVALLSMWRCCAVLCVDAARGPRMSQEALPRHTEVLPVSILKGGAGGDAAAGAAQRR